ncbi:MAG: hypothetical protein MJK18_11905, partial [Bdellovibrionales bacterium]|nr:hypothetical protein [Bdellovibrionales bacterium]
EATYYIHDYLKYVKFGFSRTTDHAGIDIRNGRMTREEACKLVREIDGRYPKEHLPVFLKHYNMTQKEFDKIVDSFTNKRIFKRNEDRTFARQEDGSLIKLFHPDDVVEQPTQGPTA